MNDTNEDRVLKIGEGFRAEYGALRLFVEVQHDGWNAGVYDMKAGMWIEKERVNTAEQGKSRATAIAAAALQVGELQPGWRPL